MTTRDTSLTLALWIGVCLVLFYGSWPVIIGAVLIAAIADMLYVQRINKARAEGFEIGQKSVKPRFFSEQATYAATFCYADGKIFQVRRDC